MAADPWSIAGFFYHPRMLAVVHLVTLGWITSAILGALYIVAPLAIDTRLPLRRRDAWAWALVVAGVAGMIAHFWFDEASGLAWSGGLVVVGLGIPGVRFLRALAASGLPRASQAPFFLAFFNFLVAGSTGILIGIDKVFHFLPGHIHDRVFAHAHLAAVGWATLLVMAASDRLIPLMLPSAKPRGRGLWIATLSVEIGALGLFAGWLAGGRGLGGAACMVALGLGVFLARLAWMLRHCRRPVKMRPRVDVQVAHGLLALAYGIASVGLGLALVAGAPGAAWKLPAIMVYGALGLLGFLGQGLVAISPWLVVTFTGAWAMAEDDGPEWNPSSPTRSSRFLSATILALWAVGVPALALSLATDQFALLRLASTGLLLAVILQVINLVRILHHTGPRDHG